MYSLDIFLAYAHSYITYILPEMRKQLARGALASS